MSAKTDTEVIVGGKVFTLSGYESEEYLQKVLLISTINILNMIKLMLFADSPMSIRRFCWSLI